MAALLNSLVLLLVVASAGINCQEDGPPWNLTSPNWPSNYGNDMDKTLHIVLAPGERVKLQFCEVDIESCCDYIRVDGHVHSQEELNGGRYFESTNNTLAVRFTSDSVSTRKGFRASYSGMNFTRAASASNCEEGTCENGGTCRDEGDLCGARCTCPPGTEGTYCQIVVEPCLSVSPCQNGGLCRSVFNGGCRCYGGYTGDSCEIPPPCCTEPCQNGGTCIHSVPDACNDRNFTCACRSRFSGPTCEDKAVVLA